MLKSKLRIPLLLLAVAGLTAACVPPQAPPNPDPGPAVLGNIVFDGSPGTAAPPATLGGLTLTPFAPDGRPTHTVVSDLAGVGFAPSVEHFRIGDGWGTWSHGYTGDVYWTQGAHSVTLTVPPNTGAFYLYAEPVSFADFQITATAQDGTSGDATVNGFAGAKFFGFYGINGATVETVTISSSSDFAVGEFGIAPAAKFVDSLQDVHAWFTRRNPFDQVPVDVQVELLKNGSPVASGIDRCIDWSGINPFFPKEVVVPWNGFAPVQVAPGDVLALRVSTRFGTTAADQPCQPQTVWSDDDHGDNEHHEVPRVDALRLFYDATVTPSHLGMAVGGAPAADQFLHSDGTPCTIFDTAHVTTQTLDTTAPTSQYAKCAGSPIIGTAPGNPWLEIGVWSEAPLS
jgi:hypothetical protein